MCVCSNNNFSYFVGFSFCCFSLIAVFFEDIVFGDMRPRARQDSNLFVSPESNATVTLRNVRTDRQINRLIHVFADGNIVELEIASVNVTCSRCVDITAIGPVVVRDSHFAGITSSAALNIDTPQNAPNVSVHVLDSSFDNVQLSFTKVSSVTLEGIDVVVSPPGFRFVPIVCENVVEFDISASLLRFAENTPWDPISFIGQKTRRINLTDVNFSNLSDKGEKLELFRIAVRSNVTVSMENCKATGFFEMLRSDSVFQSLDVRNLQIGKICIYLFLCF